MGFERLCRSVVLTERGKVKSTHPNLRICNFVIQALIQKKYESLCQDFSELRSEIQLTLNEIAECCKILEPDIVPAPEGDKSVSQAGLETPEFGDDDDYEEYGDSFLRRQLHEDISEDVSVSEKPVRIDISLYTFSITFDMDVV